MTTSSDKQSIWANKSIIEYLGETPLPFEKDHLTSPWTYRPESEFWNDMFKYKLESATGLICKPSLLVPEDIDIVTLFPLGEGETLTLNPKGALKFVVSLPSLRVDPEGFKTQFTAVMDSIKKFKNNYCSLYNSRVNIKCTQDTVTCEWYIVLG